RPDYEKFKKVAATESGSNYFLDLWYNYAWEGEPNDEHLPVVDRSKGWPTGCMFLKIRDNRTTKVSSRRNINNGINIDIMPIDPVPPFDDERRNLQFNVARELLYVVEQPEVLVRALNNNAPTVLRREELIRLLKMPFKERGLAYERFQAENYFDASRIGRFESFVWRKKFFKRDALRGTIELPFEKIKIRAPLGYDSLLTDQYGNWREPIVSHSHGDVYSADIPYEKFFAEVMKRPS
ncbi:MAG: LicD family protein, partial [Selenomonadaceae bacterium]|nr:LicD family protein [Selenomonadaceae bacterium]